MRQTIFCDKRFRKAAINWVKSDAIGPGQHLARSVVGVCSRIVSQGNEVIILWVSAHPGVAGNGAADQLAKEAAGGRPTTCQTSTGRRPVSRTYPESQPRIDPALPRSGSPPMSSRSEGTSPRGTGLRGKQLRRTRKSLASRYYQLLMGHAAIGSFLHERVVGPQRAELNECWWCNSGRRQLRHHLSLHRVSGLGPPY